MRTDAFNTALLLDRLSALTPPCLYGLGACLLARKLLPTPEWLSPFFLVAASACVLAVMVVADWFGQRRRWYTPDYAAAWLDLHNQAGGRIMAGGAEAPRAKVLPVASPLRFFRNLIWPALFVAAAAVVPAPEATELLSGAGIEREAGRLEQELDDAWEAGTLPQPDAEELRRQLAAMREMAENDPQAAAEALASLPDKLEQARTARLELVADALEKAAAAKAEWDESAGGDSASGMPGEEMERRMEELRQAMEKLAKGEGGADRLPGELGKMLGEGGEAGTAGASSPGGASTLPGVDGQRLGRILNALQNYSGELTANDARSQGGRGPSAGRQGALARIGTASGEMQNMTRAGAEGLTPGSGGVDRGRGDAPLVLGDESPADGLPVDYRPLPPGDGGGDGVTLKRDRALPVEALPPEEFRLPRRVLVDAPETVRAGQGWTGIGPARERAVERYFRDLSPAER